MGRIQKSLRIEEQTAAAIRELGEAAGVDFSTAANQLLEEAVRMRRCPGVVFTRGPVGRRATVAGTGIDVWEIVATHRSVGGDERRLRRAYHWLSGPQIRSALAYYDLYPDEIDERIQREETSTPGRLARRFPAIAARQHPR